MARLRVLAPLVSFSFPSLRRPERLRKTKRSCRRTYRIAGAAIESYAAWGIMPLWMRAQKTPLLRPLYTIDQLNHYPLGVAGVAILALFLSVSEIRLPCTNPPHELSLGSAAVYMDRSENAGPLRGQHRYRFGGLGVSNADPVRRLTPGRVYARGLLLCVLSLGVCVRLLLPVFVRTAGKRY